MRKLLILSQLVLVALMISCTTPQELDTKVSLDYCLEQVTKSIGQTQYADSFPRNIDPGKKEWNYVGVKDWTSGFYPGVLWYAYEYTGNEEILKQAKKFTEPIKYIAFNKAYDHDIGFQVYCSFGNGYRLTGNKAYKEVMLAAADTLATLYNPHVGTIHSWPRKKEYSHNTIIDNMMNLELLFWASKNGGGQQLYQMAESHAEVTMKNIVRSDNAVYHVGDFDKETGEFIKGHTHQGYADESMWARGQTWGIYGFAIASRETGRKDFLETSKKLADHFLERMPEDGIPFWDFDDPRIPKAPKDASAAAIAACGMLELSNQVEERELAHKYKNAAETLLSTLSSDKYWSRETNNAILLHSTGNHPRNSEIDVPIIYADYYFMEALLRLKRMDEGEMMAYQ
ncbi:glycoside hydrolase family 88 protein [Saccharicrinis sp. GN24d3]|uniref:glycoside hydrolase family 88 protein n=1 Tax=Saccharicrinis sp. GN24d3 TaxID=3458416 RepID=UPI0040353B0D